MNMDNLDDSENAKISDSAYSNSCSNSQSRRSHSTKSTHSGSNSSGSSGYGGQPSGYSTNTSQPPEKGHKKKESKKKSKSKNSAKAKPVRTTVICQPPAPVKKVEETQLDIMDVALAAPATGLHAEKCSEPMDTTDLDMAMSKVETETEKGALVIHSNINNCHQDLDLESSPDCFSCMVSMHDGVVTQTTATITEMLGYPIEMWNGRSFLDFVHEKDRNTFASQISNGLAVPKNVNGMQITAVPQFNATSSIVCRLRQYRGISSGFGIREQSVSYTPFQLKLSFKKANGDDGMYLVVQAKPYFSAYKISDELMPNPTPFVIRHGANGLMQYVDPESVPYLGYLPHELLNKNALQMYHPHDLDYIQHVYETIVKEGSMARGLPYRMMAQNGDFVKLETEWSSFVNPWSKKLEFIIAKHHIIEGPRNPNVFDEPDVQRMFRLNEDDKAKTRCMTLNIVRIINEAPNKSTEAAKKKMTKRCEDITAFMEIVMEDNTEEASQYQVPDSEDIYTGSSLAFQSQYEISADKRNKICEDNVWASSCNPRPGDWRPPYGQAYGKRQGRDSVILGGISPHHDDDDCKSSIDAPVNYTLLNYNDNLNRYFDNHRPFDIDVMESVSEKNAYGNKDSRSTTGRRLSPFQASSSDSDERWSTKRSSAMAIRESMRSGQAYTHVRLTESVLNRHNAEMEKELMKQHRESRSATRRDKERKIIENRRRKKEHLARCNAPFQPTSAGLVITDGRKGHGIKRSSAPCQYRVESGHKHQCTAQRQTGQGQASSSSARANVPTSAALSAANRQSAYLLTRTIPQPFPMITPISPVSGMVPMYYKTAPVSTPMVSCPSSSHAMPTQLPRQHPMHCTMYAPPGQYGAPMTYSSVTRDMTYPTRQNVIQPNPSTSYPLSLAARNYEEACNPVRNKLAERTKSFSGCAWRNRMRELGRYEAIERAPRYFDSSPRPSRITRTLQASTSGVKTSQNQRNLEIIDRGIESSSDSSFYSSFFKSDSGSEYSDAKKSSSKKQQRPYWGKASHEEETMFNNEGQQNYRSKREAKYGPKRKMQPPWMEKVNATPDLIYNYQIVTKSMEEVLLSDKERMKTMEQPALVNEQLGQLYLDLQLEGVAARLSLEEVISNSGGSGDESNLNPGENKCSDDSLQKAEYSRMGMIFEEDAPFPPPDEDVLMTPIL